MRIIIALMSITTGLSVVIAMSLLAPMWDMAIQGYLGILEVLARY